MQITAFLGVAHIHTPGFVKTINNREDVTCKYVYDHDAARAAKNAELLGAQVASLETILADAEVTSVVICSETRHHLDLVTKAAAAGKHMFVEKPLAAEGTEAAAMQEAVEKAGVVFQTGFFMRSSSTNKFIKQEIEAGNLGTVTRMRYANCHHGAIGGWFDTEWAWIADKNEAGGGGFADLGAHAVDIVLWCMEETCGKATKFAATLGSATHRYGDIDEWGAGIITFENGAVGIVEAGWADAKNTSPVEVHGTAGEIIVRNGEVFYYSEKVEGAKGGVWTDLPTASRHAFDLFWDKLKGIDGDLVTVAQAAEESRVMGELYKSAA